MLSSLQASLQQAQQAAGWPDGSSAGLGSGGGGSSGGTSSGGGGCSGPSQMDADAANAAMQTLLAGLTADAQVMRANSQFLDDEGGGGGAAGPSGRAGAAGAPGQLSGGRRGDALGSLQRDGPALLLWFGRVAGMLVQQTQQVRLLSAALVAYAAVAGLLSVQPQHAPPSGLFAYWAPAARPALALLSTQLAILAAAALLLGRRAARRVAERDSQYGGGPSDGARLPARLRQFDVLSFMPGAREALAGLEGYRQLLNGLSEDAAVYLLVCGLLSLAAKA